MQRECLQHSAELRKGRAVLAARCAAELKSQCWASTSGVARAERRLRLAVVHSRLHVQVASCCQVALLVPFEATARSTCWHHASLSCRLEKAAASPGTCPACPVAPPCEATPASHVAPVPNTSPRHSRRAELLQSQVRRAAPSK